MNQVLKSGFPVLPVYFWSDSQIVLSWLKKSSKDLQTFVANRISQIQQGSNAQNWYYVNTKENTADLASRGVMPENRLSSKQWWEGPDFLHGNLKSSLTFIDHQSLYIPELKQSSDIFHAKEIKTFFLFSRFSDYTKLKRVT